MQVVTVARDVWLGFMENFVTKAAQKTASNFLVIAMTVSARKGVWLVTMVKSVTKPVRAALMVPVTGLVDNA